MTDPLEIQVAQEVVVDLRERLARTRWPDVETVTDWSQGIPLAYVRELAGYWADGYDMDRIADRLNSYDNHISDGIHFLHVRSPVADATPVIMTHGWPGSVIEFLDVIGPLTDPAAHGGDSVDALHLVIPSLPGYGFSDKPAATGMGVESIARRWAALMAELGYERYGAQGGDWGSVVSLALGAADPDHVLGVHINLGLADPRALMDLGDLTAAEQQQLAALPTYMEQESGYASQQSTRPQTLGYGLADSPVGQLAWIIEKFYAWTDNEGHPEDAIDRDRLLDNVMAYWLTNSAASSARLYWESFKTQFSMFEPITFPTAYSAFPKETVILSERWARTRFTDLRYYGSPDCGGHFAAFEQPATFVDEVCAAFRALTTSSSTNP